MMLRAPRCSCTLLRGSRSSYASPLLFRQPLASKLSQQPRSFSQKPTRLREDDDLLAAWSEYSLPKPTAIDAKYERHVGFIGKRRTMSKHLVFADLTIRPGQVLQICSNDDINPEAHERFRRIPAHAPVVVWSLRQPPGTQNAELDAKASNPTIHRYDIQALNSVPSRMVVAPESQFPPRNRHLQIRFHPEQQARLRFRSWLKAKLSTSLLDKGFTDVETPTLFKSTSEGAREFLVPTRHKGKAYALSQSPQQYKQALMASGITHYMQWARCYRDEGARADRQPEFTQLDMEWAFASAADVIRDAGEVVLQALESLQSTHTYQDLRGNMVPTITDQARTSPQEESQPTHAFTTMTFDDCIAAHGSDKPDLRIPGTIHPISDLTPFQHFVSMITKLENPMIEAFSFSLQNSSPEQSQRLVTEFMESLSSEVTFGPGEDKPQLMIFNSSKPLCGFSSIGHEYEQILKLVSNNKELNDGDLVVFHARPKPKGQYSLSSTKLGDLRRLLWKHLTDKRYMPKPRLGDPGSLQFLWVTEFPMFKPVELGEQGQGGAAGIAACHHPFTAPLSPRDLEKLFSDPLQAKSAAYDLVLNGVEIGGGSERIHVAEVQQFIMQDVLKMRKRSIDDFAHLFDVLRSGCPPHAGFALGFDRLVALLTDTATVRDVIAFPKSSKGEDLFVDSPGWVTKEQLAPFGLEQKERTSADGSWDSLVRMRR